MGMIHSYGNCSPLISWENFKKFSQLASRIRTYFKILYEYFPPKYINSMLKHCHWFSHFKCVFVNLLIRYCSRRPRTFANLWPLNLSGYLSLISIIRIFSYKGASWLHTSFLGPVWHKIYGLSRWMNNILLPCGSYGPP